MKKNNLILLIMGAILIINMSSCDNDIDSLGEEIVGIDPNETILSREFSVKTFSTPINAVQTDQFDSFLLGSYNDPTYGRSDYTIVSQLVPSFLNPDFSGQDDAQTPPELVSAILEIPYFSTAIGIDDDGETTLYELDSLYGEGRVNLKVYRNKYFLNDFDPSNPSERARYFSDQRSLIEGVSLGGDEEILYQENNFEFSAAQIRIENEEGEVEDPQTPRMRLDLLSLSNGIDNAKAYWEDILFNNVEDNYQSANSFKDFFRGVYITAEPAFTNDRMIHLDLSNARILFSINTIVSEASEPVASAFSFNFSTTANVGTGIQANFIENNFSSSIETEITNSFNENDGSINTYLKGGAGALTLIDLFEDTNNDGVGDAIEEIIDNEWLINDAVLEFYVSQDDLVDQGEEEPERLVLYNFETGTLLLDYEIQQQTAPINSNLTHLGRLERTDNSDLSTNGVVYRMRITDYLNAIVADALNEDLTDAERNKNSRLALAVSQNVSLLSTSDVRNQSNPIEIERVLEGSAISHEGTILHGNLAADPENRPKLTIFYSEPN